MINKLFSRSGGTWLFVVCTVYLIVGIFHLLFHFADMVIVWLPISFVTALALPLLVKPLGRWLNMNV